MLTRSAFYEQEKERLRPRESGSESAQEPLLMAAEANTSALSQDSAALGQAAAGKACQPSALHGCGDGRSRGPGLTIVHGHTHTNSYAVQAMVFNLSASHPLVAGSDLMLWHTGILPNTLLQRYLGLYPHTYKQVVNTGPGQYQCGQLSALWRNRQLYHGYEWVLQLTPDSVAPPEGVHALYSHLKRSTGAAFLVSLSGLKPRSADAATFCAYGARATRICHAQVGSDPGCISASRRLLETDVFLFKPSLLPDDAFAGKHTQGGSNCAFNSTQIAEQRFPLLIARTARAAPNTSCYVMRIHKRVADVLDSNFMLHSHALRLQYTKLLERTRPSLHVVGFRWTLGFLAAKRTHHASQKMSTTYRCRDDWPPAAAVAPNCSSCTADTSTHFTRDVSRARCWSPALRNSFHPFAPDMFAVGGRDHKTNAPGAAAICAHAFGTLRAAQLACAALPSCHGITRQNVYRLVTMCSCTVGRSSPWLPGGCAFEISRARPCLHSVHHRQCFCRAGVLWMPR